jgi:OPT family oligopeptide transporter
MTNIGIGLLSPYKATISMLAGSLVSWGILMPYIERKEGIWYRGMGGISAYRWFIGVAMVLADGLCHLLFNLLRTLREMHWRRHVRLAAQPSMGLGADGRRPARSFDDRRRAQVFLRDRVHDPAAVAGYIALAAISIVAIPFLYPQLRPTHVAVAYIAAPLIAFCNAYGTGMTDVNLGPEHGKIAVLAFGWWVGIQNGGVVAGLAAGVIILSAVSSASELMQVFRTGYLTLTSPHALLISQVAGTALGCMIHPLIFWILYGAYDSDGDGGGGATFAPYGPVYRAVALALLSVSRKGTPRYIFLLSKVSFAVALALSVLREVSARRGWRVGRYLPSTVAVAISLFMPPTVPIGMFVGSIVVYLWRRLDGDGARARLPAVAAGLVCGDGLGSLIRSMLELSRAQPPMCVMFLSLRTNKALDAYLETMKRTSS